MELDPEKLNKLICRLRQVIKYLNDHKDLDLHRQIDQFYYMQKLEELQILRSQREEALLRLQSINTRMHTHCREIAAIWSKDVRRMNQYASKCREPKNK